MSHPLRSLYICYFPLTEPLVQTQVIAYLNGLTQQGHTVHLLTFETTPLTPDEQRQWHQRLQQQGIFWHSLRYHKRPSLPATAYDVLCGVAAGLKIVRHYRLDAVHARSHVPATMGLLLKQLTGCRLIFDIRGLLAEEYEDAGTWQRDSLPFRLTKAVERRCLQSADGIVVLTERVRRVLLGDVADKRVQVIPCCADLSQIQAQGSQREAMRDQLNLQGKTVMVYVGKFGSWYMQSEMVDFFVAARQVMDNLHFLVLTQSDQQLIRNECEQRHIAPEDYTVTKADPAQVGAYLAAADFAISFIKACPSKIASSPTKLGEYLAAGLPVVCNPGIGDVDAIVTDNQVGILTDDFNPDAYHHAAQQIEALMADSEVGQRCRDTAEATASLQAIGIPRYAALYEAVADSLTSPQAAPAASAPTRLMLPVALAKTEARLSSLYLCYFPLSEPLVQTQVIAYLTGLAQNGHRIHLLTFEPTPLSAAERRRAWKRLRKQGIFWHSLRYHKRPSLPATAYDVLCGVAAGLKIVRRYRLDAVHARSHVPATMGLLLKQLTGCRLIFDIRGLLAEEYEDAGTWQRDSLPFRLTKAVERRCLQSADGIVVLTERLRHFFFGDTPDDRVQVIPCCADLSQIQAQGSQREAMRDQLNLQGKTVMVYVGKLGGLYMQNELVDFFVAARQVMDNLHFLVLTQSAQHLICDELVKRNVPESDYSITRARPDEVGAYLAAGDFALCFMEPCPSNISRSPTKIGEYLAAGLPVVCNPGIGDVDEILGGHQVGVLLQDFDAGSYRAAACAVQTLVHDEATRQRCRETAATTASLQAIGIPRYETLYAGVAHALVENSVAANSLQTGCQSVKSGCPAAAAVEKERP